MKSKRIPFDIKYRQDIEAGRYRVETRDGRAARIVCWDAKCKNYPVIAEIDGKVDDECTLAIQYKKDGVSYTHYDFFLFLVPVDQEACTITSLHQEHPEVDLEKEIEKYYYENFAFLSSAHIPTKDILSGIAVHFYELGLNARKEETE